MRRKISSLIAAILIVLLTVMMTFSALQMYPTKVYALDLTDSVVMSPMSLTLTTLPETYTYLVNVTSTGTDYINSVGITFPTGWTLAAGASASAYGFTTATAVGSGFVNFTTASVLFDSGAIVTFSIPVVISTVPPTTGTWSIFCYQGTTSSTSNPVTITVTFNLEFSATMTPDYVKNGTSYIYTITVTNDFCPTGIIEITITFPAGTWSFNALLQSTPSTWTVTYNLVNTFTLTGPNLYEGASASITVNMTTPASAATGIYAWTVVAYNAADVSLGTYSVEAVVFALLPTVSFVAPNEPYYSVGYGNYMWINVTVMDTPSIATYGITLTINDSRFIPYAIQPFTETSPTVFTYYYVNNTAIPDGPLSVEITATDPAGNTGIGIVKTTVDNTKPAPIEMYVYGYDVAHGFYSLFLDSSGNYWMTAFTTNVFVYADFYNPSGFTGLVYFNSTSYPFVNEADVPGFEGAGYSVVGSNLVTLNITLTDTASPTANVYTFAWNIKRETTLPSVPTYTKTTTICGGFIIYGLTATDLVGISYYDIYFNGTWWAEITPGELNSPTLYWPFYATIQNITVLDLYDYYSAGQVANITIVAVNYGSNVGPPLTFLVTVQAGQWYPLEMYPKWNLISFPLIPYSTTTSNIYSLLLLYGAAGVSVTYGWNSATSAWVLNPTTMSDGNGYWVDMNAYDVLIVQGYPISAPPGSPPSIVEYSLTTGWNLAGYTETYYGMDANLYVASLQSTSVLQSYFRFVYVWDAYDQQWQSVDLYYEVYPYYLYPGQGFWIYMFNAQTLIPPIP